MLQKGKGTRKGERKRKKAEQENLNQQHNDLRLRRDLINGKDTQSQKPSNKRNFRPKQLCHVKLPEKAVWSLRTRKSIDKKPQMRPSNIYSNIHRPNTPGCIPKLKGRRKTLMLHHAKRRIKRKVIAQSQVPPHVKYDTQPPVPYLWLPSTTSLH